MTASQRDRILNHLQTVGPLTKKQGHEELGIENIGARVLELRARGHDIETEMIRVVTRHGTATVGQYTLVRHADQMEMEL